MNVICFDLEGPLSPQDNAYELMKLVEGGEKIFEVISRYDDILTLEKRKNYEPGDTLALIIPFLLFHCISSHDVKKISDKAKIVNGARDLVSDLKSEGWNVYIISTSYEQHALNIGKKIGIEAENIVCTQFPLDEYNKLKIDFSVIKKVEKDIIELYPSMNEKEIKSYLDKIFYAQLPKTQLGKIIKGVKVVGGQRKVNAVSQIAKKTGVGLKNIIAVGDSITDWKMLKEVRDEGGIAVVFNGNEYAIPYANIGLASLNIKDLKVITEAYAKGGKPKVIRTVKNLEKRGSYPYFHYLDDKKKMENVISIHKKFRALVRGSVAKLG